LEDVKKTLESNPYTEHIRISLLFWWFYDVPHYVLLTKLPDPDSAMKVSPTSLPGIWPRQRLGITRLLNWVAELWVHHGSFNYY